MPAPSALALPWAPLRWMSPEPQKAAATTSLLRDMPDVCAEDRDDVFLEDMVSLAVALDVISTGTKRLPENRTVLAGMCEQMRYFARLGHSPDDTASLITLAESAAGRARALLAQRLARGLSKTEQGEALPAGTALANPGSVTAAARRLEAAAALLIREAILRLAAKNVLDYRQL